VIEVDGGFGLEPLLRGIVRPAPHPVAEIKQPSSTKAAGPDLLILFKASNPTGNKAASQKLLDRLTGGRDESAVDATPVRTVTETVVVLPRGTLAGVTLQVEFAGNPVQVKFAVPGMFEAELNSNG
jgi:hypothetical protein